MKLYALKPNETSFETLKNIDHSAVTLSNLSFSAIGALRIAVQLHLPRLP